MAQYGLVFSLTVRVPNCCQHPFHFFHLIASLIDYALILGLYYLRLFRQVTNATAV